MAEDPRRCRADALTLLRLQPRPAGPRTAVVTTDAAGRLAAEAALDAAGLLPAIVTQHSELRTRLVAPAATHTGGSVTLPRAAAEVGLGVVLETLAEDPGVDAVLVAVDATGWDDRRLTRTLETVCAHFPRTTVVRAAPVAERPGGTRGGAVPAYPDLHRAAQAIATALQPPSWRRPRPDAGRKSLVENENRRDSRAVARAAALHDGGTS